MKKNILITCGILCLLILYFMYLDYKQKIPNAPVVEIPTSEKLCYERHQAATALGPYKVDEYIVLEQMGTNFVGTKRGTQAGPDMTNGYEGTLTGSERDGLITLIFDYIIEGSEQYEEEMYEMEGGNLVKLRYPLIDTQGVLAPDKTQTPTRVVYEKADCAS